MKKINVTEIKTVYDLYFIYGKMVIIDVADYKW